MFYSDGSARARASSTATTRTRWHRNAIGTFAAVSRPRRRRASSRRCPFVDPDLASRSERHGAPTSTRRATSRTGSSSSSQVVQAVTTSPQWAHTALFITHDEHGGFYDHVAPPKACAPDDDRADPLGGRHHAGRLRPVRRARAAHRGQPVREEGVRRAPRLRPHEHHALHRGEVQPAGAHRARRQRRAAHGPLRLQEPPRVPDPADPRHRRRSTRRNSPTARAPSGCKARRAFAPRLTTQPASTSIAAAGEVGEERAVVELAEGLLADGGDRARRPRAWSCPRPRRRRRRPRGPRTSGRARRRLRPSRAGGCRAP